MRNLLIAVLSLPLLAVAIGCMPCGSTRPTIKIGLVASFEGLYRPLGYEVLPAAKLAVSERNEAGGVGGHLVELVVLNDDQDQSMAVQRAREMVVDPDVMGVIGHFSDDSTASALSTYHRAGLALVVPTATGMEITGRGYPQTFRLVADNDFLGAAAARYAVTDKQATRLAAVRGSPDLVDAFVSEVEQEGGVVVLDIEAGDTRIITRLADVNPELIFFGGEALEGAELLLKLHRAGLDIPVLGGNGLNGACVVQIAGDAAEGTTYVAVTPPVEDQGFIEGCAQLSGAPPGPYAALAYDATNLLLEALERSITLRGKATREGVVQALSEMEIYRGLTGSISFDERGQAVDRGIYIYEIVHEAYPGQLRSVQSG